MKKVVIFVLLSGLFGSFSVQAIEYGNDVPDCVAMGYNTDLSKCPASKVKYPSHCPYDYNKVRCWTNNCQGYPFNESEINSNFVTESCFAGVENNQDVYFYRYASCAGKDGVNYRFDNGDCIDRCDTVNKYPFDNPPGSLAGTVESCYDDKMHYGYSKCNEGFGKLVNGTYNPVKGRCDMLICDIWTYPFLDKPDEARGTVIACAGGSNKYYRYDVCKTGYEKPYASAANCVKRFALEDKNFSGVKIGDYLTYKGTPIGTFFHLPEEGDNRYLILSHTVETGHRFAVLGERAIPGLPDTSTPLNDKDGKINTYYLVNDPYDNHPIGVNAYNYYPTVCSGSVECGATVWYAPACLEWWYMYLDKYVLYSSFPASAMFSQGWYMCSRGAPGSTWIFSMVEGKFQGNYRLAGYSSRPIMAIGSM